MPVCLPGVCRLLSNGASIYPSRVLVPLPCHAGMNVAAKVRQMSLKCSPVLPSEVFRLGIINPWKGLNVPSCGCVAFLHGKMQCAASSIVVRCIGNRSALRWHMQRTVSGGTPYRGFPGSTVCCPIGRVVFSCIPLSSALGKALSFPGIWTCKKKQRTARRVAVRCMGWLMGIRRMLYAICAAMKSFISL